MRFEFDPEKSAANLAKHGIDFETAQALWNDPHLATLGEVSRDGEERQLGIGNIEGKLWTFVSTRRGDAVRIISVRRARFQEADEYHRGRIRPNV
jgi:uncharacterized DUF497 family protein